MNNEDKNYINKRKLSAVISLLVIVALAALLTVFVCRWLSSFTHEGFRSYIKSFGAWGVFVLLGLQVLQVFIALIPGELLETAAGYAFGPFVGTLICYVGIAIGTVIIFFLTRKFGVRFVEIFVAREKINELRFINTDKKRNSLVFLLFFIPGTPKDLITYFVGITDIKFITFIVISLVARIPSVVSSTFGGHMLGEGNYLSAIILYGITGAVSIVGLIIYNSIISKRNGKKT